MRNNETIFRETYLRVENEKAGESQTTFADLIRLGRLEPCPLSRVELSAMVAEIMG